jgi:hypothetical protein
MHLTRDGRFVRTDIWREGQWLDLWSVVHLLSGVSMGFIFTELPFERVSALTIGFLLLVGYELWEAVVDIEEAPTNRVMDVVVGMVSFVPTYLLAPGLESSNAILTFGLLFTANIVLAVFGWVASRKAAVFEARLRARAARRRELRLERRRAREEERLRRVAS